MNRKEQRQEMAGKPRQEQVLIEALARGTSRVQAARQAGVSERTVFRRLNDSEFCGQVATTRAQMIADASGKLSALAVKAVDTLEGLLKEESPSIRLAAAKAVLDSVLRLRESEELANRLDVLEEKLAKTEASNNGKRSRPACAR